MQNKLQKTILFLAGLTFFVPLIFLPKHFIFPFIVPKIVIFRSLVLLMLGVYIVLLSMNWQKFRPKPTALNIVVFLFWLSFAVSTFLGVDVYRSIWDGHERMLGFFTISHYVIYYFILASVVQTKKEWHWLIRIFLLSGSVVMVIAFLQQLNPEFLFNRSEDRSASTLGNPIYVGGYGLFLAMLGWYNFMRDNLDRYKWASLLIAFFGALGVFFSGSRGALLGLFAAIGVLAVGYIFTMRQHKKIRQGFIALIGVGIVLVGVLIPFRQTDFVKEIPALGRLLNTGLDTAGTRIIAWGIALDAWQEKPIFGWGPTNYYYAYNKFYDAEVLRYGYAETWFDNAHNIVLNTLAERGVFGEIAFLALFIIPVYGLWRNYKKDKDDTDLHFVIVATAFLAAHFVQTISVFENPTSYLYFLFFLALMHWHINKKNYHSEGHGKTKLPTALAGVVGLLTILAIFMTNVNPARANLAAIEFIRGMHKLEDVRGQFQTALSIPSPHVDDIRNDFVRNFTDNFRRYVSSGNQDLALSLTEIALNEGRKNLELHPMDIRVHAAMSLLLQEMGNASKDTNFFVEAEKIVEDGLALSPQRQQFIYTLAGVKFQLGKFEEVEQLYFQAIEDEPKVAESWWRLAILYDAQDRSEDVINILNRAIEEGDLDDFGKQGDPIVAQLRAKHTAPSTAP